MLKEGVEQMQQMTLADFTRELSGNAPVPGGGGAAALCGGMYMLICAGDGAEDASECIALADAHLERMRRELERECAGIS